MSSRRSLRALRCRGPADAPPEKLPRVRPGFRHLRGLRPRPRLLLRALPPGRPAAVGPRRQGAPPAQRRGPSRPPRPPARLPRAAPRRGRITLPPVPAPPADSRSLTRRRFRGPRRRAAWSAAGVRPRSRRLAPPGGAQKTLGAARSTGIRRRDGSARGMDPASAARVDAAGEAICAATGQVRDSTTSGESETRSQRQAQGPAPGQRAVAGLRPRRVAAGALLRRAMRSTCRSRPSGARSWVQRVVIRGRRRDLGLGGFPLVSLSEARAAAHANRKLARSGGDPLVERRRAADAPTFAEAARRVWADKRPGWRHPRHASEWLSSLERHVFPRLGHLARARGHQRRRARRPAQALAPPARDRPAAAPAHRRRHGVGRGHGVPHREPLQPHRPGARTAAGPGPPHAGAAPRAGRRGHPDHPGHGREPRP